MARSKRDELIQKATDIFYRRGFQATGMDTLVVEAGISKTSIYKHFKTKDDLIVATLRLRDEFLRGWLFRRMAELASTPRDQLIAMFDALDEWFSEPDFHGCMFAKACSEFQDPDHPINREATAHVARLSAQLAEIADRAGLPNPNDIARRLSLLKEGAVVMATMGHDSRPALEAKAIALGILREAEAGRTPV
ncbi:MAG: TetR family transcriptional regulator [Phenylobacterium sp.]|uniref:TetR/AcrR family transcriptional regulator n=1 Tax=Phenylobacterium sp. TaxID=1871053 RepID=UPI00260145C1|nr:TetR/AcrR family transcriptional regulator [Phenylobacterium sp.]MBI1196254.1 TetR family transcriptional regulator [Phenylobacterium sp.]